MSTNISLGTYISDGVRSGPFYTGRILSGNPPTLNTIPDVNGVIVSASRDVYGPGILYSPQYTWNITPNAPSLGNSPTAGVSGSVFNVVAPVTNQPGANGLFTLTQDAVVNGTTGLVTGVTAIRSSGGISYLQLDVPRVINVSVTGANPTANSRITIVGGDWYGMPMQQTYVLGAQGVYPFVQYGYQGLLNNGELTAATIGGAILPCKAFYTVTSVQWSNGAIPAGCTISLGASNIFGLPYLINDFGDVMAIGWGQNSDMASGVTLTPLESLGMFLRADQTNPATAITGDVRGLYAPAPDLFQVNGTNKLRFTSYVSGADVWQNQVANIQMLGIQNGNYLTTTVGTANTPGLQKFIPGANISPLNIANLYGQPQFYTGNPS